MANKKAGLPAKSVKAEVSTVKTFTPAEVPGQIEILQEQLNKLIGNKDETVSTDVMFRDEKIKEVSTLTRLLEISSAIHERANAFQRAKERHGVTNVAAFEQDGKSVDQWDKIISKAIRELQNAKQIEVLKNSITKLEAYLDNQTKLDRDIKAIMAEAGAAIK